MKKTPQAKKEQYITELLQYVEVGKQRNEVIAMFCEKTHLCKRTFDNYWAMANERHIEVQKQRQKKVVRSGTRKVQEAFEYVRKAKDYVLQKLEQEAMELEVKGKPRWFIWKEYAAMEGYYAAVKADVTHHLPSLKIDVLAVGIGFAGSEDDIAEHSLPIATSKSVPRGTIDEYDGAGGHDMNDIDDATPYAEIIE